MQGYYYYYYYYIQFRYIVAFLIWEDEYTVFKEEWTRKVTKPNDLCK